MSQKRMKMIEHGLAELEPIDIKIEDEGHLHVGHAGAKSEVILSYILCRTF